MRTKIIALSLIGILILIAIIFLISRSSQNANQTNTSTSRTSTRQQTTSQQPVQQPLSPNAQTTLTATLSTPAVSVDQEFTINIDIATGTNAVSGVQLELMYDPTIISINTIAPGAFFDQGNELINKNDTATGTIMYAIGSFQEKQGSGTVVTLTGKALKKTAKREILTIQPSTKVAAVGEQRSVLQKATGATLTIE